MKTLILAAATVAALAALPTVTTAQASSPSNPHHRVLGYQDSVTGKFHPLAKAEPDTSTPVSSGTIKLTLTILIRSTFPSNANLTYVCGANVTAVSLDQTTFMQSGDYDEQAYSPATVSGSTATCTVTVPYSWIIPLASSTVQDTITGSYSVQVINNSGTITSSTLRLTTGDFLNLTAVPETETTTVVTRTIIL